VDKAIELKVWQEAVESGARDVAFDGMGNASFEVIERTQLIPEDMPGAFIPLLAPQESVQIGLVSTPDGCAAIARALLQGGPDLVVSEADIADALGEAANILAGFVKRNMQEQLSPVNLGLPLFINGHLANSERVRALVTHVRIGQTAAALVVIRAAEWKNSKHAA
jgi:hypothetical protein